MRSIGHWTFYDEIFKQALMSKIKEKAPSNLEGKRPTPLIKEKQLIYINFMPASSNGNDGRSTPSLRGFESPSVGETPTAGTSYF